MAYYVGIDIGSQSTKCVVINQNGDIVGFSLVPMGGSVERASERAFRGALEQGKVQEVNVARVIATGYGRKMARMADGQFTEIICHARGCYHLMPGIRTLIDIGGQDSKVIHLSKNGSVGRFVMNDKCAAGTGRFLEVMARALECDLSEMGARALRAKNRVAVSSICTVFAESEVISLLATGVDVNDVIRAIAEAVANRTVMLVHRIGLEPPVAMSGGVAKNEGVVYALEEILGVSIKVLSTAQLVGALGAALMGRDEVEGLDRFKTIK
ncbi:MAG: acyl-CoA dehydratase activase [Bacillota bacterium]